MPAYGKVKVDTITYDLSGTATDVSVADIATKASPTFTGTINAVNLILSGDLTVNGTTTTIDTTTLQVEDKNIEIGKVSTPSDTTADGGGWTLKGATDKTFNWVNATDAWTSSEHIHLGDNKKLLVGDGSDLQIYHDGTDSVIKNSTNKLRILANEIHINNNADSENLAKFTANGAAELYYDDSKKFETDGNGINVIDNDSTVEVSLTDSNGAAGHVYGNSSSGLISLLVGNGETSVAGYQNGTTQLFHDNVKKFETTATGVTVTGTVSDSKGDLRKIIQNTQGSAYTLVAADAGKHILASGNITIPNSIFSAGDGVVIVNNTSGDLTITSGITNLYLGTDGSTGNKTLASRCTCTVLFTSGTAGYISGGGLS